MDSELAALTAGLAVGLDAGLRQSSVEGRYIKKSERGAADASQGTDSSYSIAQHSAAQHSAAQAQHSTAPAQHSTAQPPFLTSVTEGCSLELQGLTWKPYEQWNQPRTDQSWTCMLDIASKRAQQGEDIR